MKRVLVKWWYRRRFNKACHILKDLSNRHRGAGHEAYLKLDSTTNVHFHCVQCPELQPLPRRSKSKVGVYRDSRGRDYK